jgi:hypothetical protein
LAAALSKVWNDTRGALTSRVTHSTVDGTVEATAVGDAESGFGWHTPRAHVAATMTAMRKDQILVTECVM